MVQVSLAQLEHKAMMIITLVEYSDWTCSEVVRRETFDYSGPVAWCDRSLKQESQQGVTEARQTAGQYGATAQGVQGFLVPQLEKFAQAPPGYSPQDLSTMESGAMQTAAGESGAARERATLQAARTSNVAALPGQQAALTAGATQAGGNMLQNILARNAQLKAEQQQSAQRQLGDIYGTAARGQLEAQGLVPKDIEAGAEAEKVGWAQNLEGIMAATGQLAAGLRGK